MSEAVGSFAVAAYSSLPIAQVVFAITILVLGPMALFRRTRAAAGMGTVVGSYVFGLTTWFLGARVTFGTYGWVGLFIGLLRGRCRSCTDGDCSGVFLSAAH